jgi:hypothetical protein
VSPDGEAIDRMARHRYRDMARIKADDTYKRMVEVLRKESGIGLDAAIKKDVGQYRAG